MEHPVDSVVQDADQVLLDPQRCAEAVGFEIVQGSSSSDRARDDIDPLQPRKQPTCLRIAALLAWWFGFYSDRQPDSAFSGMYLGGQAAFWGGRYR